MGGFVADIFSIVMPMIWGIINQVVTMLTSVMKMIQGALGNVMSIFTKLKSIAMIGFITSIGICIFKAFTFSIKAVMWFFVSFLPWIFTPWPTNLFGSSKVDVYTRAGFMPWLIKYIMVIIYKVSHFPKCFIWYVLDIVTWLFYLPFRFLFWLFDSIFDTNISKTEHNIWNIINDIDYYIHGPKDNYFLDSYVPMNIKIDKKWNSQVVTYDKFEYTDENNNKLKVDVLADTNNLAKDSESLNLGYHIIHFPDSIMNTCYATNSYILADLDDFPMNDFQNFIKCLTSSPF